MRNTIVTSKAGSDPFDRHETMKTWMTGLEEIGVDQSHFAAERQAGRNLRTLQKAQRHYSENASTSLNEPARALARDPQSVEHVLEVANMGAASVTPEHRARVLELLDRAQDAARRAITQAFWNRGETLIDLLRPAFDEYTKRIVDNWATIPNGVRDLDDATRLGHADEWLQLEQDIASWRTTTSLLVAWIANGIIGKKGDRPGDWMMGAPDAYRDTLASRNTTTALASAITAGRPQLGAPTEEQRAQADRDRLDPPTYGEIRTAAHEAEKAEQAARATLPLPART